MSLQLRLIGTVTALLMLALAAGAMLLSMHARSMIDLEVRTAFDGARHAVSNTLKSDVEHTVTLRQVVASFEGQRHVRAALVNEAGKTIVQSKVGRFDDPAPLWFQRLMAPQPLSARIPIALAKYPCVVVLTSDPANEIAGVWSHVRDAFTTMALFCFATLIAMSLAITSALRFFRRVQAGLLAIAHGSYEARLHSSRVPEFAQLAAGFNHMADQLSALSKSNRQLYAQLQNVQEEERAGIARDLHDEVGAYLFAIQVDAKAVAKTGTPEALRLSNAIRESVTHIQNHVKNILRQLKPVSQLEFGLESAVRDLIAFWARRHPDIAFEAKIAPPPQLDRRYEETAYRVVQEALSNAIRHGAPKTILIDIHADARELTIAVQDDGGGIKLGPDAKTMPGHAGLAGMRERIQALNGRFVVHQSGGGVRVSGVLPLAQERSVA
ncbi:MAG TPA: sensor histidine kinase [Rhizomicrobium sp.]|nr:sensor histidine kinase [Rhizomicrobium sp.]